MKRDMDLVRGMLLSIEQGDGWFTGPDAIEVTGWGAEDIRYHLAIMVDAALVKQEIASVYKGAGLRAVKTSERPSSYRMTWAGHDFIDTVRDPEVWKRTKDGAGRIGGWTFGLLKDLGTAYLKHVAKERLGLDL